MKKAKPMVLGNKVRQNRSLIKEDKESNKDIHKEELA